MRPCALHLLALVAVFALGCSPTRAADGRSEPSRPAAPSPTLARLEAIARELDRAVVGCADSCCIEGQRWWRQLDSLEVSQRDEFRAVVNDDERPRIRALAIFWLAAARHADDLPLVERFLASQEAAWSEPVPALSQRAQPCYPLAGVRTLTVGEVALAAVGRITGRSFDALDDYREWRAAHATAADSLAYWHQRGSPFAEGDECRAAMRELSARDPGLLLRLAVALWHRYRDPVPECPRIDELAALLRVHYGQDRLLLHLRDPSTWAADRDAEYAKDTDWRHFALWAFTHAQILFEAPFGDALVAAATSEPVLADPELLGVAAVAAGRLRPSQRDAILDAALVRLATPPPDFVEELARTRPKHPAVRRWFLSAPQEPGPQEHLSLELTGEPVAEAAARGLCMGGREGIALARALATDPAARLVERPRMLGELAEGALAGGAAEAEFACRRDLVHVCHKLGREACAREKGKEPAARAACLAAFERWATRH